MNNPDNIISIVISRRALALCFWSGLNLTGTTQLQLHSNEGRAMNSMLRLLNDAIQRHSASTLAWEQPSTEHNRVGVLLRSAAAFCRQQMLSSFEVQEGELKNDVWLTPFRTRGELRSVALKLWPVMSDHRVKNLICDAAVVGLSAQCHRLVNRVFEN
jgi:hypothetical protein